MAHPSNVFCVSRIPQRPVIHFNRLSFGLHLPNRVHQHIDSTLGRCLCVPVKDRHAEDDAGAFLAGFAELF